MILVRTLLTPTYTTGIESRSLQQRNVRLNAAKVSNMVILSLIWTTAAISAVYKYTTNMIEAKYLTMYYVVVPV